MIHRNQGMSDHLPGFEKQGHEAKKKGTPGTFVIHVCRMSVLMRNQITRKLQEAIDGGLERTQRTLVDSLSSHSHWTNEKSKDLRNSCNHGMPDHISRLLGPDFCYSIRRVFES